MDWMAPMFIWPSVPAVMRSLIWPSLPGPMRLRTAPASASALAAATVGR